MTVAFNADEILAIAEKIETNGAAFYRKAAEKIDADTAKLLRELSTWEDKHQRIFHEIRTHLTAQEARPLLRDPDDEEGQYLQVLADKRVFDVDSDPLASLGAKPTAADVLRTALRLERDSVVFYVGLKELVPPSSGRDKVELVLQEEMKHISILSKRLAEIKA
jgi:rubrerythrin